jgi:hypothetical protein
MVKDFKKFFEIDFINQIFMTFDVGTFGEVLKLKTDYGTVTYHRYRTYKSGSVRF